MLFFVTGFKTKPPSQLEISKKAEKKMSDTEKNVTDTSKGKFQRWGMIAGAILLAFLVGLIPMWLTARSNAAESETARTQLRKSEIGNLLLLSIVDARRGEYEIARQGASEFFTLLRAEEEKGNDGFLTPDQRTKMASIFSDRDAAITMLAQRDPASLDRLTDIYMRYSQTVPSAKTASRTAGEANATVNK